MKKLISIFCTLTLIISVVFSISLPVCAIGYDIVINFENDSTGNKPNGWSSIDSDLVKFYDSLSSNLIIGDYGHQSHGLALHLGSTDQSKILLLFSEPMNFISLEFGDDDPGWTEPGDEAVLELYDGSNLISEVRVVMNRNDNMDQSIEFSGDNFDKAIFYFDASNWPDEVIDNIYLNLADQKKPRAPGNHELVTLLTNPMDNSGVRTMDLNYYMNDPIIWGTDVKNITVWLETEIFDLATAKQKVKLPTGLMLLKDYNIRLMMKIVYNDGTVETKEVDNSYIARNIPVLIPVDEFAGTSDLGIVYMDTEGNTAVLPVTPVTIDGINYLKFENNHFSEYGVVSGTAQTPAEQQQYIIQPGDTLASIAAKFGKTVQSLATANNISNPDMIYASKILIIA